RKLIEDEKRKIIAVGTTTLRTLESLYWLGIKTYNNKNIKIDKLIIEQWDAVHLNNLSVTVTESLNFLLNWMEENQFENFYSTTQLLITPRYSFKTTDGLITNFHQPQTTLLLIVAAIAGDDWKKIYEYALENKFRF